MLGAEYRQDFTQHQKNYDEQPYVLYQDNYQNLKNAAYYFQDNFSVRKNLILVGALRSDWYEQFGSSYSPRAGLVYTPLAGTRLKLIFNRAFRAPNRYEQFYVSNNLPNDRNESNPLLQPERINSYEAELEHDFGKVLHATATGFENHMQNLITPDFSASTGSLEFTNANYQDTHGLEFEISGRFHAGWQFSASDSFQNSYGPTFVINSPHHLAKANVSAPLWRGKLFASFNGQYTSRMSSTLGPVTGGFGVVNATLLARRITSNLDLSANVENLFDKRYGEPGGLELREVAIPQDGRSFRGRLTYRFSSR